MTTPTSEIQFARTDDDTSNMQATAYRDGSVTFLTGFPDGDERYFATLAQTIQLRDFLNRHIDSLALQQTGSLAERSSDDPAQLSGEELLQAGLNAIAPPPLPATIPVDDEAKGILGGKIRVLAVQASDVFDAVNGALQLAGHSDGENVHASAHPQRWLQAARMDVQTGLMKLERAVRNPSDW